MLSALGVSPTYAQNGYTTPNDLNGNGTYDFQESGAAPVITDQPDDVFVCPGSNTVFSVTTTGSNITYQWQLSTNGGTSYSDITSPGTLPTYAGYISSNLTLNGVPAAADDYQYRVLVSSSTYVCDTLISNAATLDTDDATDPTISCPSDITANVDAGNCTAVVNYPVPTGSDNCAGSTTLQTAGLASGAAFPVGNTTNTFEVTDAAGNTATCSFTVTVNDNEDPTISCPSDLVVGNDLGSCDAEVTYTTPVGLDNCAGSTTIMTSGIASGGTFPLGTTTVTYEVTDAAGNTASCSFDVTVNDTENPVAVCQTATINLDAGGNATLTAAAVDGGSTDNCAIVSMSVTPNTFNAVGTYSVTLTVVDAAGNSDDCMVDIDVVDNNPPVAVCQDIDVYVNAAGTVMISSTDLDGGSTDNGTIVSYVAGQTSFNCSDLGANNVTLTVTDDGGNTDNCVAVVTVIDTISPTATCQNITVQLNAAGAVTIAAGDIDNGSSDNCSVASLSLDVTSFDCTNIGANIVTLTVTDGSGNSSTCTATVTIEDNVAPTAICQDITVQLSAAGAASITASDIDNGSTDACGIASLSVDVTSFDCTDIGANTVTLTVTDNNGNSSTCAGTVTVEDNVAPTATCQDITVQLNAAGAASITAGDIDNGSNDGCGIASLSLDNTAFTCADVGSNTVTLTVTDNNGNSNTCTATVTVEDDVAPTAICQDITVQLDGSGNASTTAGDIDNGSSDNCSVASLSLDVTSFDCTNIGANIVTLTVTDGSGNSSTCSATVTVEDNVAPTAICQDITVQLNAAGAASITVGDIDNGSNDACGIASLSLDNTAFTCADVGSNTVTLTVTDNNGNISTCTATVTVEDNVAPSAVCQDITAYLDAAGTVSINASDLDNGSTDACGGLSFSISQTSFDCSEAGANTVTLTVTDGSGNSATCSATVTVVDTISPVAVCQTATINLDAGGNATLTAAAVDGGSTDNCAIVSMSVTPNTFTAVGTYSVTLTVVDAAGNSDDCTVDIDVVDNNPPVAVCQDIDVYVNAAGMVMISSTDLDGGSTDNGTILSIVASDTTFDCTQLGANNVTVVVTDNGSNTDSCTAVVNVIDTIAPSAVCQDINAYLDATGNVNIAVADIDNGSADNCAIDQLKVDQSAFDCSALGLNTISLIAIDASGNSDICIANITILDTIAPTAACQPATIALDAFGNAVLTTTDVDGGSIDNCSIASAIVSPNTFNDCGTYTVTYTVVDVAGNTDQCTVDITVVDGNPPVAVCQDIDVHIDANGNATIASTDLDGGSNDNVAVVNILASDTVFDCRDLGPNNITLSVMDDCGNVSTCIAEVTVIDTIAPNVIGQDIIVQLDPNGVATIAPIDVDNGSTDNCAVDSLDIDVTSFDCTNIGTNTVVLAAFDASGNTSSTTVTVTVVDDVDPVAICQDITVHLDASGIATITVSDIDGGSNDACGIDTMSIDQSAFDCSMIGSNNVTLTVVDVNGNISTCVADVTVLDTIAPTALCQNITVYLDNGGNAAISANQIDAGSSDNCGVDSLALSQTQFDCADVGVNTVSLTVFDANGNSSICSATVTVLDSISPVAVCQPATIAMDSTGVASLLPADVDGGSSDNCSIDTMVVTPNSFTSIGTYNVVLVVTDPSGNTDSCSVDIDVIDLSAPTAICNDTTIYVDANGQVSISSTDLDGGSTDNDGIVSIVASDTIFDCSELGANSVQLVVTDNAGNTDTCVAVVTVLDTISPTLSTQDITIQLDSNGTSSIVFNDVATAYNDNCAVDSTALDTSSFMCSDLGINIVTLSVWDPSGNLTNGTANVTVVDQIAPVVTCSADISVVADSGACTAIVNYALPIATDNCSIDTIMLTSGLASGSAFPTGTTTVSYDVIDPAGNVTSCSFDVVVTDDQFPTISCPGDIIQSTDATSCDAVVTYTTPVGLDNCPGAVTTLVAGFSSGSVFPIGTTTVTHEVVDASGNVTTCSFDVTIVDSIAPVAICQTYQLVLDTTGFGLLLPSDVDGGSTDNCSIVNMTVSPNTFDTVGTPDVTLVVYDAFGNVDSCSVTIAVISLDPPIAVDDTVTVGQGESLIIENEANDWDPNNDPFATTEAYANNGTVIINGDGTLLYEPDEDFCGTDYITYTICDTTGLCDVGTVVVIVECNVLIIPEGFSPDNDMIADTWVITGLEHYPNNSVTIFNRWGNEVYSAAPYNNDWDGWSIGKLTWEGDLPEGTYYYILELNDGEKPRTGFVYLKRMNR